MMQLLDTRFIIQISRPFRPHRQHRQIVHMGDDALAVFQRGRVRRWPPVSAGTLFSAPRNPGRRAYWVCALGLLQRDGLAARPKRAILMVERSFISGNAVEVQRLGEPLQRTITG
jgi:hypothetical protein